jgi:hypothetical protein
MDMCIKSTASSGTLLNVFFLYYDNKTMTKKNTNIYVKNLNISK